MKEFNHLFRYTTPEEYLSFRYTTLEEYLSFRTTPEEYLSFRYTTLEEYLCVGVYQVLDFMSQTRMPYLSVEHYCWVTDRE